MAEEGGPLPNFQNLTLEDHRREEEPAEPRTREDFLRYSCGLTLDPNTAHRYLRLSEENRAVTRMGESQPYPDHPKRFQHWNQVLCTEGLSGRCYWEAEWRGDVVHIAVTYQGISRTGSHYTAALGRNDNSWALRCTPSCYSFSHNNNSSRVRAPYSRIGVYLDRGAGTLSFYSVHNDTMTLLRTVQTTFPEPLYPAFWLQGYNSSVRLCDL